MYKVHLEEYLTEKYIQFYFQPLGNPRSSFGKGQPGGTKEVLQEHPWWYSDMREGSNGEGCPLLETIHIPEHHQM